MAHYRHRVSPFGHPRLYAYSGLTGLFAGLHVLLRLSMPRHPPTALNSLIIILSPYTPYLYLQLHFREASLILKRLLIAVYSNLRAYFTLTLFLESYSCLFFSYLDLLSCFQDSDPSYVNDGWLRLPRLELGTSTLSVSRSNQLSYDRKYGG